MNIFALQTTTIWDHELISRCRKLPQGIHQGREGNVYFKPNLSTSCSHSPGIISLKIHRPQLAQWCWSTFEGALMREKTILFPLLVNSSFSGKRRRSESCYVLLRCRGVAVFWVIILNLTLGTLSAQIQSFLSVSKLACLTLHTR